jgi:peptidoglycan/LPS O-acetylase OafA/YrhL
VQAEIIPTTAQTASTDVAQVSRDRVFHTLDALRGIAAAGVVALHLEAYFTPLAFPGGYLAVDLFFMMSGVVIAHAYDERLRRGMTVRQFMRARLIRLYPLYALGTLIGLAATIASLRGNNLDGWTAGSIAIATVFAAVLLPNLYGRPSDRLFPLDTPCWSLFLELLVNLVFGALWARLTVARLKWICLVCAAGVLCYVVTTGNVDHGYTAADFVPGMLRTGFGFSAGVLIARSPWRRRQRVENTWAFVLICALVVIAIAGCPSGPMRTIWDAVCVLLLFPLLVYGGTIFEPPPWLRSCAAFLGLTSYAVYVLHGPLSEIANSVLRHLFHGEQTAYAPWLGVALLGCLLSVSWVIDRWYDTPVRRALLELQKRAK